ncbi:MAG: hypothetical protein OQJ99_09295, partial [Rhodospirillales bacterium]|nr:hypothetical protein [Rhodospirillales bacterium]
ECIICLTRACFYQYLVFVGYGLVVAFVDATFHRATDLGKRKYRWIGEGDITWRKPFTNRNLRTQKLEAINQ